MSLSEDMFFLQVNSDFNALSDVLNWFEKVISPRLSPNLSLSCQLALSEGFTNVVTHAHQDLPATTPVNLEVSFLSRALEIRIWDCGKPFDLETTISQVKLEDSGSAEKEHGRGLIFLKELTDEVRYFRDEQGKNCLLLRKEIN